VGNKQTVSALVTGGEASAGPPLGDKYLIKKSTVSELAVENTVEIIAGPFKGMKATITRLEKEKEEATVILLDATYQLPVTVDANYLKLVPA